MSERWTPEALARLFAQSVSAADAPEYLKSLEDQLVDPPDSLALEDKDALERVVSTLKPIVQENETEVQSFSSLASSESAPESAVVELSDLRWAFRRAASVLTALDPSRVWPVGQQASVGQAEQELASELVPVYQPPSDHERWMLSPEVRNQTLVRFGTHEELLAALAVNSPRPATLIQQMIEECIAHEFALDLDAMTLDSLTAVLQAVRWLEKSSLKLPSPEEIQTLIEGRNAPAVFEKMAGMNFVGREKELALLRDYVGVLAPSSGREALRRGLRGLFHLHRKPPLVIYAPGGSGKTTLISKFILDHQRVDPDLRFPYVYLDFDNPQLNLKRPWTILAEASRQLSLQYPGTAGELRQFLDSLPPETDEEGFNAINGFEQTRERRTMEFTAQFALLLRRIIPGADEGGAPFLLALDTYEEVQYRGIGYEIRLWDVIEGISLEYEGVRVVVFGRAPLERVPTTEESVNLVRLEEFDERVAFLFLERSGITDRDTARSIQRAVGRNPLSLKLAAEVYRRSGEDLSSLDNLTRPLLFFRTQEKLVQGQLFNRILSHIHDADVRKLAHPGLLLRTITPELIKEVLGEVCDVPIQDAAAAQDLFEKLGREVALVERSGLGQLRARPEIRALLIPLLTRDSPEKVQRMYQLAAEFYSKRDTTAERADEIYYLLQLRRPGPVIDAKWVPGAADLLRGSLNDLPEESRPLLASRLGVRLDSHDASAVDLAEWERYAVVRANEYLKLGRWQAPFEILKEREDRTPGSLLYLVEVKASVFSRDFKRARNVLPKAFVAAQVSGNRVDMFDVLLLAAGIAQQDEDYEQADSYFENAAQIASDMNDRIRTIGAMVVRIRMHVAARNSRFDMPPHLRELAGLISDLSDEIWVSNRTLIRGAVTLLGFDYSDLWVRMLDRVGFGELSPRQLELFRTAIQDLTNSGEGSRIGASFLGTMNLERSDTKQLLPDLISNGRLEQYFRTLLPLAMSAKYSAKVTEGMRLLYLQEGTVETDVLA